MNSYVDKVLQREYVASDRRYSPAIDGLRAIAVIAVIIFHFSEDMLPSGYLGVDMFFVISGFVITSSLLYRREKDVSQFFLSFYIRRIKRLLPALVACFVITGLAISFFNPSPQSHLVTGLFSLVGFSNVDLYFSAIDYWGDSAKLNPYTHTWSLGVEEQFYFIFPLILWFVLGGIWKGGRLKTLIFVLLSLSALSLALFVYASANNPISSYYLLPSRFWEIGLGCALATYLSIGLPRSKVDAVIAPIPLNVVLAICISIFFIPNGNAVFATIAIVVCTLIFILKIRASESLSGSQSKILTHKLTLYLGTISYSLYLWHWSVIAISRWTIGISSETVLIQIALIALCAVSSYHYIEKPFRAYDWKSSKKVIVFFTVALILGVALVVATLGSSQSNLLYLGGDLERPSSTTFEVNESLACEKKNTRRKQKILTLGNSHSNHIVPMLNMIAENCDMEVFSYPHPHYVIIPSGKGQHFEKVDEELAKLDAGDLLILSSRNRHLYLIPYLNAKGDKWLSHTNKDAMTGYGLDRWMFELNTVVDEAKKRNINVLLFLPNIEFDQQVLDYDKLCRVEWFRVKPQGCDVSVGRDFLNSRFPADFEKKVYAAEARSSNLYIFDPFPIYCSDSKRCLRMVNGTVAFRDTNHLTPEGSLLMLDKLSLFLAKHNLITKN
ncbi:MAG: peptidoglycan/LPS O-acetylase OafA/YrhL [Candidatus Azotimanducaceae bacterium]